MIPEDRLQQLIDSKDAALVRSWTSTRCHEADRDACPDR